MTKPANARALRSTTDNAFMIAKAGEKRRQEMEAFIQGTFLEAHNACIHGFMPYLLALMPEAEVRACVGLRPATERLFIERYLDIPLSEAHPALDIDRQQIIEVGNLASISRQSTLQLFVILARAASQSGFKEMVFCATSQVAGILTRVGADLHPIIDADGRRMGDTLGDWGSYYDHQPVVMRLNIASLDRLIESSPFLNRLAIRFASDIQLTAEQLSS